jgi:hypothetical protein
VGLGDPQKLLLKQVNPDIVFLQETLVDGEKDKICFLQYILMWNAVSLDPSGHYGG